MSRVVVNKGSLGDRFDKLKRKDKSEGTQRRRGQKQTQTKDSRDEKMGKRRNNKQGGGGNNNKGRKNNNSNKGKRGEGKPVKTAEELDRELEDYVMKNADRGKEALDAELEEYNKKREEAAAAKE